MSPDRDVKFSVRFNKDTSEWKKKKKSKESTAHWED